MAGLGATGPGVQDVPGRISPVAPKRISWGPASDHRAARALTCVRSCLLRAEVQAAAPSGRSEENTPTRKLRPQRPRPPRGPAPGLP